MRAALSDPAPLLPGAEGRLVGADAMAARIAPMLAPAGVTRLARLTGLDSAGVEVFAAIRPAARSLAAAGGKGLTRAAARLSAAMEALEVHHAERPALRLHLATASELPNALDIARLPRRRAVAEPLLWAEGASLEDAAPVLLPFPLLHACWLDEGGPAESGLFESTNGLASGSHPVEAALHGLCELIERDALALFARLPEPARAARRMRAGALPGPVGALADALEARGFALTLWEASSDIAVPVFFCALSETARPRAPSGFGGGCAPDPETAALRAIAEAAQTRLVAISGTREDVGPAIFSPMARARFGWARAQGAGGRDWAPPGCAHPCLRETLRAVVGASRAAGVGRIGAVALADAPGFSVVRVVAEGLEPPPGDALAGERALQAEARMR